MEHPDGRTLTLNAAAKLWGLVLVAAIRSGLSVMLVKVLTELRRQAVEELREL